MLVTGISLLILVSIAWFVWRFASRRHSLPCPSWLSWMVEMDNPFTKVNRASTIIECLSLKSGMRVLDVGCGPGRLTIPVAKVVGLNGTVVALDIQQAMLDKVRKKAAAQQLNNIQYKNAAIGTGALNEAHFDRVLLVTVLGEIPDQLSALNEIHSILAPNGILSITEIIFDPHFQRQKTVIKVAAQAGFKVSSIYGNAIAYTMHLEKM